MEPRLKRKKQSKITHFLPRHIHKRLTTSVYRSSELVALYKSCIDNLCSPASGRQLNKSIKYTTDEKKYILTNEKDKAV